MLPLHSKDSVVLSEAKLTQFRDVLLATGLIDASIVNLLQHVVSNFVSSEIRQPLIDLINQNTASANNLEASHVLSNVNKSDSAKNKISNAIEHNEQAPMKSIKASNSRSAKKQKPFDMSKYRTRHIALRKCRFSITR